MRLLWVLLMAIGLVPIRSIGGEARLTAAGALNPKGERVRALGVNYYDAFARTLASANDTSYDAGFAVLAKHRIPFVRLSVTGYWPVDMGLYQTNRNDYFRRMDGVVRSAERHGIGLIPSLFWYYATVPDLMGEPIRAWGDPGSRTMAFLKEYTREVVGRYAGSPAIWAWEFGNEFNLACDLPNASEHRPPIQPTLGTALERSAKDELRYEDLKRALATFAEIVREFDKDRLITSGDAVLRTSAWNNRHRRSWTKDTPEQSVEMLADLMGRGLGLVSVHLYGEDLPRLEASAQAARVLNRPVFVGEFQFTTPGPEGARAEFGRFLERLERERVLLAAVWVFDFASQAADYSITADNDRAWQLGLLREWNQRLGW